jgi:ankyrin repeat protein
MYASTDLHVIARCGTLAELKQHIAAGDDVNAIDVDGQTPLALAEAYCRQEVAEVLRRAGAL